MSQFQETDNRNANVQEFSVSEISGLVKRQIEDGFAHIRVRAELGRVSRPASGHLYLDLKDEKAVLSGVIWKGAAQKLPLQPEQGLEVICTGKLTTFAGQSKYQMIIEYMEPAGVGALMALLEERKKKLTAEGLFEPARKKKSSLPATDHRCCYQPIRGGYQRYYSSLGRQIPAACIGLACKGAGRELP